MGSRPYDTSVLETFLKQELGDSTTMAHIPNPKQVPLFCFMLVLVLLYFRLLNEAADAPQLSTASE
jgi:hypothetical protein